MCSISGIQSAAISYLGEFLTKSNRAIFVTLAAAFLPLATAYQPLLAKLIMPYMWRYDWNHMTFEPWRLYMLINTSLILFTFPSMMLLPEGPKFLLLLGKKAEAIDVLRRVYVRNTRNLPEVVCKSIDKYMFINNFLIYISQSFPIKDLQTEGEVMMVLSEIRSPLEVIALMWRQTWPLFVHPYRNTMLVMLAVIFNIYFVAHGFFMW